MTRLSEALDKAATVARNKGDQMRQRAHDWHTAGTIPKPGIRGGGTGDTTGDREAKERREDRQAGRYHDELHTLERRMEADAARYIALSVILLPAHTVSLQSKDMLAAQVAADGWCVNCWRDEQTLTAITERPNGQRYYRDRCKPCGDYKGANGEDRPIEHLRAIREGRRVRVKA